MVSQIEITSWNSFSFVNRQLLYHTYQEEEDSGPNVGAIIAIVVAVMVVKLLCACYIYRRAYWINQGGDQNVQRTQPQNNYATVTMVGQPTVGVPANGIPQYQTTTVPTSGAATQTYASTVYNTSTPTLKPQSDVYIHNSDKGRVLCAHCLTPFQYGERGRVLECYHKYHDNCMDTQIQEDGANDRVFKCKVCNFTPKGMLVAQVMPVQQQLQQVMVMPASQNYVHTEDKGRVLCSYCLRPLQHGQTAKMLNCYHKYHEDCLRMQVQEDAQNCQPFKCKVCYDQ
eukprot:TRINITY_DN5879_c0_g1_i4.p2 TRINITY_DN5879_c0_g1~~TRINITY_DN5879_c0_g1_i4.p2  ORF type:complete len:284 (+),score=8.24 TRINITY_DN5879_c0_g1_i4:121-972(+)